MAYESANSSGFSDKWWVPVLGVLMIVICFGPVSQAKAAETGKEIFEDQCTACHTIGKGKLVGPDLAGVTARREKSWLVRQIKDPESLIEEKDPIALQLLREADDVPMSSLDLSDAEVAAVIGYLKSVEKLAVVTTGVPSQYMPTVLISLIVLIGLTLIGIKAGNKNVDVR